MSERPRYPYYPLGGAHAQIKRLAAQGVPGNEIAQDTREQCPYIGQEVKVSGTRFFSWTGNREFWSNGDLRAAETREGVLISVIFGWYGEHSSTKYALALVIVPLVGASRPTEPDLNQAFVVTLDHLRELSVKIAEGEEARWEEHSLDYYPASKV